MIIFHAESVKVPVNCTLTSASELEAALPKELLPISALGKRIHHCRPRETAKSFPEPPAAKSPCSPRFLSFLSLFSASLGRGSEGGCWIVPALCGSGRKGLVAVPEGSAGCPWVRVPVGRSGTWLHPRLLGPFSPNKRLTRSSGFNPRAVVVGLGVAELCAHPQPGGAAWGRGVLPRPGGTVGARHAAALPPALLLIACGTQVLQQSSSCEESTSPGLPAARERQLAVVVPQEAAPRAEGACGGLTRGAGSCMGLHIPGREEVGALLGRGGGCWARVFGVGGVKKQLS